MTKKAAWPFGKKAQQSRPPPPQAHIRPMSTLPRILNNKSPSSSSSLSNSPENRKKRCFSYQMSPGLKAFLFLFLILGVTSATAYFIYAHKFARPSEANVAASAASEVATKASEANKRTREPRLVKLVKDSDPDLYMDYDGNLHPVSELRSRSRSSIIADKADGGASFCLLG